MTHYFQRWVRAETAKLWSLPTAHLTALGTLVASVVLAIAFGVAGRQGSTGTTSVLDIGLAPVGYSQAGFVILGVVVATSEYSGGQIYTTLTAMPHRTAQHFAKLAALSLFTIPVAVVTVLAGIVVAGIVVGNNGSLPEFGETARVVGGATGYLTLTALLSAAVAAVIRRTIPAVAGLLVYYFIAGPLLRDQVGFAAYLPDTAGYSMWFQSGAGRFGALSALTGSAVVLAWVVLAVAASATAFHRRDA